MNNEPLVSIVTATYNMAHFIDAVMESITKQTYENWQHIIIDDGSEDDTSGCIKKYLHDERIEYYYQENAGQTTAKNNGIKKAKGKYICFLDGDNIWELDKLQKQIDTFANISERYKIIFTEQLYIDGEGNKIFTPEIKRYSGRISAELLFENFVTFNTVMVNRICFDELGLFDENLQRSIDYELWLRFSTKFDFYYMPDVTTYYRHHEGQMSQDKERRFKVAGEIMTDFLKKHPGLIANSTVNRAWGHSFTSRGRYYASKGDSQQAINYFIKALKCNPLNYYTLKSILRLLILRK